ncbi:glycosyltransferase [uncultured Megasphaera sp.]|uniref:glycosyltransferase family 2 protein n=1 Tax=uncultured Megasphaera sp. TaxID=165188 RepID=UPI0025F6ECDC|nr:glycosyltransferase [uncultured Megasphaera sp.]
MDAKLSVIIPVYNSEAYLRQTLASVLAQTYENLEVLAIDDGSPDGSLAICREFAQKDARLQVFHKENGGVSSARNFGLERAKGEYIAFLDGDDCIDPEMYAVMISVLEETGADLVDCRVVKERSYTPQPYEKGTVEVSSKPLEYLSKKGYFIDSSLNKVYRRELIGATRFDESISYSEDKLFVTEVIFKAKKMALVSNVFYHYIQHGDSLSWQDTAAVWQGNFQVHERIYRRLQADGVTGPVLDSAFRGYVRSIIALLRYDIKHRLEEEYNRTLKAHKDILKRFLKVTPLPLGKKLEYLTYTISYGLASFVHYHAKRRRS